MSLWIARGPSRERTGSVFQDQPCQRAADHDNAYIDGKVQLEVMYQNQGGPQAKNEHYGVEETA